VDVYTTEDQQLEAIKRWWKKNGTSTVVGILIALAIVIGGRTWISQQHSNAEVASAKYDTMIKAMEQGMNDIALEQSAGLIGQFSDTPYAALAALASAKIKLAQGESLAARTHLQWAIANAQSLAVKQVARVRLARVMLNDGNQQQALALLGEVDAGSFVTSFEELKGDIFISMSQPEKARQAYDKALDASDANAVGRDLLRMKIDDLGSENAGADGVIDKQIDN